MKIALINHTFSLSHGGLERHSVNLATSLAQEGHEVHVFACRAEDLAEGVEIHSIPVSRRSGVWRLLRFQWDVRKAIKGTSFDIVYGLTRFFPLDIYRMGDGIQRHWVRIRYPFAPWRWLNYLLNPVHALNLYLERRISQPQNCSRIVTNSKLCRDHAHRYYGIDPHRVRVIYNGVDHDVFAPEATASFRGPVRKELGLKDGDIAILYVSNNWKRKGLAVVLKALALLGEGGKNFHVLAVGRGKSKPFLALARRLGLEGRLHIVGATTEVHRYYGAGDLLVLPTLYDPFANVCLEAMACGLPVVTTAENGASELIREAVNGYVQNRATDAEELAGLLGRCLDKKHLRAMGREAYMTARPYTRERNMRESLDLFQELPEGRGQWVRR